LPFVLRSRC